MIPHFLAKVSILELHLLPTSTYAELSAILASRAPQALQSSLHSPIHIGPHHHHFPYPTISSSYPSNLSNLIFSVPHSQTSFKTHRP